MNRRSLLKALGLLSCASLFDVFSTAAPATPVSVIANRKKALSIAHITDIHIKPGLKAPKRLATCFQHIQSLPGKIDLILNGGDTIMDALSRDRSTVKKQWNVWNSILQDECVLPMENCIGNHDIWGAGEKNDILYGKSWAMDTLQLDTRYRSFDRNGWHFIILDSIHARPDGSWYIGKLDEEQFDWLQKDLKRVDPATPVLVMSHIPVLSSTAFFDGNQALGDNWQIPHANMHTDAHQIVDLLHQHPNVKVCLSGHLHLLDRVAYKGITFLCNGAVSGNWWNGAYKGTKAGYALLDLYNDGSFDHAYVSYR